jgi:hypothetical protein
MGPGDRVEAEAGSLEGAVTISWLESDKTAPIVPEPAPPKQITYQKPEMPADLSPGEWSILMEVLELLKRTLPTNADLPPAEVFAVLKAALLEYCRKDEPPAPKIVLRPRGKSGK